MMCGESCRDGSILAVGEIRPSKDISHPSLLSVKTKTAKCLKIPGNNTPFDACVFGDLMNISLPEYLHERPLVEVEVG